MEAYLEMYGWIDCIRWMEWMDEKDEMDYIDV
jgi:hypothetical protein